MTQMEASRMLSVLADTQQHVQLRNNYILIKSLFGKETKEAGKYGEHGLASVRRKLVK